MKSRADDAALKVSIAFADSFPLLPLSEVSHLYPDELVVCESGLKDLLGSLTATLEDRTLAQYAERQLLLVQQVLRHSRATERVQKLLLEKKLEKPLVRARRKENGEAKKTVPVCKPFVVSSGDGGNKARRKRKQTEKAQDAEISKQQRREASYQRLLARRALQADKSKARCKRKKERTTRTVQEPLSVVKEIESSSTESDVSNCSESDEADEKAIIALTSTRLEPSVAIELVENANGADEIAGIVLEPCIDAHELVVVAEIEQKHAEKGIIALDASEPCPVTQHILESAELDRQEKTDALDSDDDTEALAVPEAKEDRISEVIRLEYPTFDLNLQEMITQRRECKLTELMAQRTISSSSDEENAPQSPPSPIIDTEKAFVAADTPEPKPVIHQQTFHPPPVVHKHVTDYSQFFSSFSSIVTSVFERTNFTSASVSDRQILSLQLRLYQNWHSIMYDYNTVFRRQSIEDTSPYTAHYRVSASERAQVFDIVVTALQKLQNWEEHPSGLGLKTTWNLLWTWSKPNVERKSLLVWQRVNHFLNAKSLTRKDCLKKSVERCIAMGGKFGQAYSSLTPKTFLLPKEYVNFVKYFYECANMSKNIWIMKPVASSRGRGISIIRDLSEVIYGEHVIIQQYIENPLLLDGYKFDLRLYVLVTSFSPLEAFIYKEGFVRLCSRAYDSTTSDRLVHLTNSSLQQPSMDSKISKKPLQYLWDRLQAENIDIEQVKETIKRTVLQALICGEDQISYQINSFDLFGFDILLDSALHPWLIEINSSPSMAREYALDFEIKDAVIYDTMRLVRPLRFNRQRLMEILERRCGKEEPAIRGKKRMTEMAMREMNKDLTEILDGEIPRAYGELPKHLGRYERISPYTSIYNQIMALKKGNFRVAKHL